jgi:hypothetical protein
VVAARAVRQAQDPGQARPRGTAQLALVRLRQAAVEVVAAEGRVVPAPARP